MANFIYGKIVKILSATQIVINKGENDGVKPGMKFVIFEDGEEIVDSETGNSLGKIEIKKGEVYVKQTMPSLSILETGEILVKKPTALTKLSEILEGSGLGYTVVREKEKLNVDKELGILADYLFGKNVVKENDKVRQVIT